MPILLDFRYAAALMLRHQVSRHALSIRRLTMPLFFRCRSVFAAASADVASPPYIITASVYATFDDAFSPDDEDAISAYALRFADADTRRLLLARRHDMLLPLAE